MSKDKRTEEFYRSVINEVCNQMKELFNNECYSVDVLDSIKDVKKII